MEKLENETKQTHVFYDNRHKNYYLRAEIPQR